MGGHAATPHYLPRQLHCLSVNLEISNFTSSGAAFGLQFLAIAIAALNQLFKSPTYPPFLYSCHFFGLFSFIYDRRKGKASEIRRTTFLLHTFIVLHMHPYYHHHHRWRTYYINIPHTVCLSYMKSKLYHHRHVCHFNFIHRISSIMCKNINDQFDAKVHTLGLRIH